MRKCQYCKEKGLLNEMEFEIVGQTKPVKKFYHKECFQKHLKDKEFKKAEQVEKDELNEMIKKIYGVSEIPSQAWTLLEKLRGGNKVFGNQQIGKRYKEGYKYSLITKTFDYCSDTIAYWNSVKDFNGSFMQAFKYALSIIIDKIYHVEQREKERESRRNIAKRKEEVQNHDNENLTFNVNKGKKDDMDISDLLD